MKKPFPKTPLKGEARPLGEPAKHGPRPKPPARSKDKKVAPSVPVEGVQASEKISQSTEESACADVLASVESQVSTPSPSTTVTGAEKHMATLKFKGLSKSGKVAIYTGLAVAIRIATTAFKDKQPPAEFEASSDAFAVKGPKETPEERKARLKAAPKPTLAEKVAKLEAKLAAQRKKLEADQAKAAEQPQPVGV